MAKEKYLWWQTGIVYEIYIRSFQDSNSDGLGDIRGVLVRLDYLEWLGVTAIWLTPFYTSPMKDFGYDISDYTGVDPVFGTMRDFDELLEEVHRRKMKLIIDFVPNHTSSLHPWFSESRSAVSSPKRDWYIWKDPKKDGSPPNNWMSVFGGSAWEWDEKTQQYYYHAFLKEQPDLNLHNPEVLRAIKDVMRFWLDKGVDGFRIDVMWHLAKDEKLRDNPLDPDFKKSKQPERDKYLQIYSCDQPEVHDIVHQLRQVTDEYQEKVLIGELYLSIDKVVDYYGHENQGAHLPGNFQLLFVDWDAQRIAVEVDKYEAALPPDAWPNWVMGNHDRARMISRIGEEQARNAAILLLTLRGTPTIYYGDEIAMQNVPIPKKEWQDPQGLLMPEYNMSRDPQRTPMQWNSSPNAGFTTDKPWLRIDKNFISNNVELQKNDADSLLLFYKKLIELRQKEPALNRGDYYPVVTDGKTLAYIRRYKGSTSFLIVLNLTGKNVTFRPLEKNMQGKVVLSGSKGWGKKLLQYGVRLNGNEGVVAELLEEGK